LERGKPVHSYLVQERPAEPALRLRRQKQAVRINGFW
jgi:hypothetical protein